MDKRIRNAAAAVLTVALIGAPLMARDIRLNAADGPDPGDIRSLVTTVTAGCRTEQEKMIALWGYITRNDFYHWAEARQQPEATSEMGVVIDPVAALNVHGTLICYQVCDVLANLAEAAGIKARTRSLPGHRVMEAFCDGKWRLFDATYDCQAYYVGEDGKNLLSLDEVCADPDRFVRNPPHPSKPFFQFDQLGGKFWAWETKAFCAEKFFNRSVPEKAGVFPPLIARGHVIGFDLRRGEKLIRRFDNQGKWYCSAALYEQWRKDPTQRWVDKGPHDPRRPGNTYANGELIYQPDWKVETNFRDGLDDSGNLELADGRIRPAKAGAAWAVFRVQSPYLIVGRPGKLDADGDSTDGAALEAEFFRANDRASNVVSVSTDNGLSWRKVWTNEQVGRRAVKLDLTAHVEGTYGYLVRIELDGPGPADAYAGALCLRNSLFYSPIHLPRVRPGRNAMSFRLSEGVGRMVVKPDLGDGSRYRRFFKQFEGLEYSEKYTTHLQPVRQEGFAVVEVAGPPGAKITALAIHGSFGVRTGAGNAEAAEILWAVRAEGPWSSAWKSDFSARNDKWRWDDTVDVAVEPPAERCFVKVLLKRQRWMSLNGLGIAATYNRTSKALKPGQVAVTHAWTSGAEKRTHVVRPDPSGQAYDFEVGDDDVRNESVTIEVANDR